MKLKDNDSVNDDYDCDAISAEYRRQRNSIAREFGIKELKKLSGDAWSTAKAILSTDLRTDFCGMLLLRKFRRAAVKFKGGSFADDGEAIGLWVEPPTQVKQGVIARSEKLRVSVGRRALFHPGYLPLGKKKEWKVLRVQNPNPSPYVKENDIDWLWCIAIKPGLSLKGLKQFPFDFFVGEKFEGGGQHGVFAEVKLGLNYDLDQPYVTTQRMLDRIVADVNAYVEKLQLVRAAYEKAGLADKCPDTGTATSYYAWQRKIKPLWPGMR